MKRCPTCQRTYTDESLTFCLEDGAALLSEAASSSSSEPPATMFLSEPPATSSNRSAAPTEIYNANATNATDASQGSTNTPATQAGGSHGYTTPPPSWAPPPPQQQSSVPSQGQSFGQASWATPAPNTAPPNKFLLGILGGVVMALPSLVPLVQWVCCIWALAGGLLAAALYIKKSPTKVETGEAAIIGAIAGGVGGLINLFAGLPIAYALYGPKGPYASNDGTLGAVAIVGIFGTLMLVGFAIVGGVVAVPMFEKRKSAMSAPPPPPPPPYGGGSYR
jgi:hypothetical protein